MIIWVCLFGPGHESSGSRFGGKASAPRLTPSPSGELHYSPLATPMLKVPTINGTVFREGWGEGMTDEQSGPGAAGGQHANQVSNELQRTEYLKVLGYRVLRFWNHEVLADPDGCPEHDEYFAVLESIRAALVEIPSPPPSPGGRGS